MAIAILAVLVLIAILIAPWLLGVAAVVLASYGVVVLVVFCLFILAFVLTVLSVFFSDKIKSWRMNRIISASNKRYRAAESNR